MTRTIAAMLAALTLAPAAASAAECPRTTVGDVEDEVMCPVCGTPLALATEAPQAVRERALIERLVADCQSKEQIKDRLKAEFGDDVVALPGGDGFDLAAYLVPALAVLAGGVAVGAAAIRWRRTKERTSYGSLDDDDGSAGMRESRRPSIPPAPAAAERLQSDLDRYDL